MTEDDFFSLENSTDLEDIPKGARIHIIGVCGVAMGALAIALSESGYQVSGSDKEFYPPMSEMLDASSVTIYQGYSAENITEDIQLVVIGNSAPRINPEVQALKEKKIPYTFFAKFAGEALLKDRTSIVASGTHGKTTTTSILAYGLKELGHDPSYFIGGKVKQLPTTLHIGSGEYGVIEGDEYDSVFYVKRPKFLFYPSNILIINAIEFDHADIYPDLKAIEKEFEELLERMPSTGTIIACSDYESIRNLLKNYSDESSIEKAKIITFGEREDADYQLIDIGIDGEYTVAKTNTGMKLESKLKGAMNIKNILATTIAAEITGIDVKDWVGAVRDFTGASRRLEKRYDDGKSILLEDFAHHPTAVRETIRALHLSFPDAEHWIAFEPRSNTSRRNFFQKEYGEAFIGAQKVFIRGVAKRTGDEDQALLDVARLKSDVEAAGECSVDVYEDGQAILVALSRELDVHTAKKIVITIMSNGGFDGLPSKLTTYLEDRNRT